MLIKSGCIILCSGQISVVHCLKKTVSIYSGTLLISFQRCKDFSVALSCTYMCTVLEALEYPDGKRVKTSPFVSNLAPK